MTREKQLNDTADFEAWSTEFETFQYYLYNITNPIEASTGSLPEMESIGPFVYRRYSVKSNINFNQDNTIISFTYNYEYQYQPDQSIPIPLNEYIWTISGFVSTSYDIIPYDIKHNKHIVL